MCARVMHFQVPFILVVISISTETTMEGLNLTKCFYSVGDNILV